jgi:hypothetical protein
MTSPISPDEKAEAILRSAVILFHARAGRWHDAGAGVTALAERFEGAGIQILIMSLADTMVAAQGGHTQGGIATRPVWVDPDGAIEDADDVSRPEIVWAGRFIAARAAQDEDACAALVNSCGGDPEAYSANIYAVLEVTADTLNMMGAPA